MSTAANEVETVESRSDDSLDDFILKMEATLDKHLDARLRNIEVKQDATLAGNERILTFLDALEKVGEEMQKNPMIASMLGGDGFDFS